MSRSIRISQAFYRRLLAATNRDVFRNGDWRLCERSGWPDNQSYLNVLAWCWIKGDERHLVVINFRTAPRRRACMCRGTTLRGRAWRLGDALSDEAYERDGTEMGELGLYVDLAPWSSHVFRMSRVAPAG